ncbi:MAG: hypothetical protein VCA18_03495, partial [Opitutales bacterium]
MRPSFSPVAIAIPVTIGCCIVPDLSEISQWDEYLDVRQLYNFEEFRYVGAVVAKGLAHRNFACRENFDEQTRTTPKHYHEQPNETGRLVGGYFNCNEPFGC